MFGEMEKVKWEWLRTEIYTGRRNRSYGVGSEEVRVLKENLESYLAPFMFVRGDIGILDFSRLMSALNNVLLEFYNSFGISVADVKVIESPEGYVELKELLFRFVNNGGYRTPFSEEQNTNLARYFAHFCSDDKDLLEKFTLASMKSVREVTTLSFYVPEC